MSRYNLRPNLLEDVLQEFELVRLQGVEWRRLKKRHGTSVRDVGQRLPVQDFKYARRTWRSRVSLLSLMTPKPRCRSGASWRRGALSSKGRCACRLKPRSPGNLFTGAS